MNKMDILLKQLAIDDDQSLKEASIKKVYVHPDNRFTFYIESHTLLPLDDVLRLLKSSYDLFPYECEFFFDHEAASSDGDILKYAEYIFEEIRSNYAELENIDTSTFSIEDNILNIKVINEIQLNRVKSLYKELDERFSMVGIDIGYNTVIDEDDKTYQKIVEEMDEERVIQVDPEDIKRVEAQVQENKPYRRYKKEYVVTPISEIDNTSIDVCVQGYVFREETIDTKKGKKIQVLYITDYTDSITVKRFENARNTPEDMALLKKGGKWIRVNGHVENDSYENELIVRANTLEIIPAPKDREDKADVKRVELHAYSNMSTLDGISTVSDYISRAAKWGHKAIAITDHGNVQCYPDAAGAAAKNNIKIIYGVEFNMVDVDFKCVYNERSIPLDHLTYVSFDLETTGLSRIDDHITEFGAVKIKNGLEVDRLQSFIRSPKPISAKISQLTNITNKDIENAPTIEEFMPKILEFFGDELLVAHNGVFDIGMLNMALKRMGQPEIQNTWIDTLPLARYILPMQRSYRLGAVCNHYKIPYSGEEAHRADYDAEVLGLAFNAMIRDMQKGVKSAVIKEAHDDLEDFIPMDNTDVEMIKIRNVDEISSLNLVDDYKHAYPYHIIVLAKKQEGIKDIFKLVSKANTNYFYLGDRLPRHVLKSYREKDNILLGSGCLNSRVFEVAATKDMDELREEVSFYDYIEIQPLQDAQYLVDRGRYDSLEDIQKIYQRIIEAAKAENKLIVATGDVHFLDKKDKIFREVFISNDKIQINKRPHPLLVRGNPRATTPDCYFRTTQEMMDSFPYLSHDETFEYVVKNTNKIADMIEDGIKVIKDKLYPPHIKDVDQKLRDLCYHNAHKQYGNPLPANVEQRLEHELQNIIKHGYAVIYYIASLLVTDSNDHGYLVGSRGSVGSSFVATMANISEVNPLAPHYYCPNCGHNEFIPEGEVADGFDLPDKICPECGTKMKGDGHKIPFETFLGFNADKTPDIDLNFSGDYQPNAHNFLKKQFGDQFVYRAGTMATVAEKTAYGYAKAYAERMGTDATIRKAELQRLADGCTGVKRTTGQHPGGIIVIPDDMDVFDFTPYQYPADDVESDWRTTHFDFHKIDQNVLKFDILGHVDPTVTRMLQDLTEVDPKDIPTNDPKVMSLFTTTKEMGIDLSFINCKTGALGLPEFGTPFVRGMLEATHPTTFADLVIISGLSHGTDVYLGNAETLIKTGTCTLKDVIGCRDDIMVYLIEKGLPNKDAFDIMECVRKGKSPKVFPERGYVELMKKYNVPQWYIDSCLKIKYMFPKAHAAAYVLSAIRVAWWKMYYPREYYAVYFSTRCDAFEIETMIAGKDHMLARYNQILNLKKENRASNKEEDLITVFEVAMEMYERGYHFNNIDLNRSLATNFSLDDEDEYGILPSFTSIDGLGENVALSVVAARQEHEFTSIEDVDKRTRLTNTHMDTMKKMGIFDSLSESDQLSIFDLLF